MESGCCRGSPHQRSPSRLWATVQRRACGQELSVERVRSRSSRCYALCSRKHEEHMGRLCNQCQWEKECRQHCRRERRPPRRPRAPLLARLASAPSTNVPGASWCRILCVCDACVWCYSATIPGSPAGIYLGSYMLANRVPTSVYILCRRRRRRRAPATPCVRTSTQYR